MERDCVEKVPKILHTITHHMLQMAVTGTMKNYFVAWTPHRMITNEIYLILNSGVQ